MEVRQLAYTATKTLGKHSPTILTGFAVAGVVSTAFLAVRATPKAIRVLGEMEEDATRLEQIKATWSLYLPAAGAGAVTVLCIIGVNSVHFRRNAAIAALYSITDAGFSEYKQKVSGILGEHKEGGIRDSIAEDKLNANPVSNTTVLQTSFGGDLLTYDSLTGRYFYSDIEHIRRVVNELNRDLITENYIALNELYHRLGLSPVDAGALLGWNVEQGLLEVRFSTHLTKDDVPCLVIDFETHPKYM